VGGYDNRSRPGGNGFAIARDLNPSLVNVEKLRRLGRKTRRHSAAQLGKLADSIERFGFVLPIVVDGDHRVIAGWGMVLAAIKVGLSEVPAIVIADLNEAKRRMLRLALNRLGEDSGWDLDELKVEFSEILEITSEIDLRATGFEMGELDVALSGDHEEDVLPTADAGVPVTKLGDLWLLGDHRILCGDSTKPESFARLLENERAEMGFTDPPWNIPIAGHVSGLGNVKHEDFAMACGEMSAAEFEAFLRTSLGNMTRHLNDGAVVFVAMHWSKIAEMLAVAADLKLQTVNLCVWVKPNGAMGSLYRSRHELIFAFKHGNRPHINNVKLGRFGRNRTNVWEYAGQNVLNGTSRSKLSVHPTAKPVGLVADAIRDCSNRGGVILDAFGGVGATLIAAERTGRKARLIELEPKFVDVTVRRWEMLTGRRAVNADTGAFFGDIQRHVFTAISGPVAVDYRGLLP
jgi:DNA modification methylase